ncbi:hypothetical protein D3C80_998560 [compost metagenome]
MRAEEHRKRGKRAFPEGNGRNREQGGTRGDANNAGIGKRIAEQALHHRAGDAKRRTDQHAKRGAWQAHGFENDPVTGIEPGRATGKISEKFGSADTRGAADKRHATGKQQDADEHDKRDDRLPRPVARNGAFGGTQGGKAHGFTTSGYSLFASSRPASGVRGPKPMR